MEEDTESMKLVQYLMMCNIPFTHISNETYTPYWSVKSKNKKLWVKPWIPDYMILLPKKNKYKMIFIEMKRKKWWIISENQKNRIQKLNNTYWVKAYVCHWADEAIQLIYDLQK